MPSLYQNSNSKINRVYGNLSTRSLVSYYPTQQHEIEPGMG
jgi:hypothetical protein